MIIYAHRGARGYAPENTMAAFKKALALKADGIELDVHTTKDGQLVVCHDHNIDRTSNGSGWIRDFTLSELKAFDFGKWFDEKYRGEQILSFEEFFLWYVKTPLLLNIEIKNGPVVYQGIEKELVTTIKSLAPAGFNIYDRILISSFYHPSLYKIKELDSKFKTGVLYDSRPMNVLEQVKAINADYLHPHWHYLDRETIEAAQELGIGVNCYTINTEEEFKFISEFPLTGIFSDYPDRWLRRNI
ncbi:glycerophosphodiester phosphodiesterase [Pectinatus cerevisiiphilus]|uniref:Glycerophosphoryl diester phosphodiesterase n=1 Tax=Pectinatus cerevisiiphilus TaxID=86956 RepID=A0A4R3KEG2_9FIRM|nr:glycerophosphodiester phosphodiesterase [Pectinatus cerevisiiphilus]TCS81500.1 glycerophosphoryl diester phosphodiesterase [Pectinatus cerevisiiphilus]